MFLEKLKINYLNFFRLTPIFRLLFENRFPDLEPDPEPDPEPELVLGVEKGFELFLAEMER